MPEVNHFWQASPTQEPITALGIVASRAATPDGYTLLMCTPDGADADLWKGGLFKGKSTRYLCFTRNYTNHTGVSTEVISDIRLVDEKDTVPIDYIALLETLDTKAGSGSGLKPKSNRLLLVTDPTLQPSFVITHPQLFEISCSDKQTNREKNLPCRRNGCAYRPSHGSRQKQLLQTSWYLQRPDRLHPRTTLLVP
uniref:Multivesicular body subunit 12B n=1 Tax=Eptatretus burgeri TaxID=7764 RepID=A0A8C4WWR8_EPTBU